MPCTCTIVYTAKLGPNRDPSKDGLHALKDYTNSMKEWIIQLGLLLDRYHFVIIRFLFMLQNAHIPLKQFSYVSESKYHTKTKQQMNYFQCIKLIPELDTCSLHVVHTYIKEIKSFKDLCKKLYYLSFYEKQ